MFFNLGKIKRISHYKEILFLENVSFNLIFKTLIRNGNNDYLSNNHFQRIIVVLINYQSPFAALHLLLHFLMRIL